MSSLKDFNKEEIQNILLEKSPFQINTSNDINIIVNELCEVNKAKWAICSDGYYPYCTRCYCEPPGRAMTDYCPMCGANMKESVEEHDERIRRWKEDV